MNTTSTSIAEDNSAYTLKRVISKRLFPVIALYFFLGVWESLDAILVATFAGSAAMSMIVMLAPLSYLLAMLQDGLGYGATALFTQAQGRNDKPLAAKIINTAFTHIVLWALLISLCGIYWRVPITDMIGVPERLQDMAADYLLWFFPGLGILLVVRFLDYVVSTDNNPRLCVRAKCTQIALCITLALFFMGPCGLGAKGFAIALLFSSLSGLVILGLHFFSNQSTFRLRLVFPSWKLTLELYDYFRISIFEDLSFMFTLIFMNHFIQRFPEEISALYFICIELYIVVLFVAHGTAQALTPLLGVYYGEDNFHAIKLSYQKIQQIGILMATGVIIFLLILSPWILPLYHYTYPAMRTEYYIMLSLFILFIPLLFYVVNAVKACTYTGNIKIAMWLQVGMDFIFLLPFLLMASLLPSSILLWLSFAISNALVLSAFLLYKYRWEKHHGRSLFIPKISDNNQPKTVYYLVKGKDDFRDYQLMANLFLANQHVPESIRRKAELILEEMVSYASETGVKSEYYIDIRISVYTPDAVRMIAKIDNRAPALKNVLTQKRNYSQSTEFLNLRLIQGISRQFIYNRVLDLDVLDVSI